MLHNFFLSLQGGSGPKGITGLPGLIGPQVMPFICATGRTVHLQALTKAIHMLFFLNVGNSWNTGCERRYRRAGATCKYPQLLEKFFFLLLVLFALAKQ